MFCVFHEKVIDGRVIMTNTKKYNVQQIAKICHDANKAYYESLGDDELFSEIVKSFL